MAKIIFNSVFFCVLFVLIKCTDPDQCDQDGPCRCVFEDATRIDISQLLTSQKIPTFLEDTKNNYTFYFHGCEDAEFIPKDYDLSPNLTLKEHPVLVQYTQPSNRTENSTDIGNLTALAFAKDITYHTIERDGQSNIHQLLFRDQANVTATLLLICDTYEIPYIKILGDPKERKFALNSPHACLIKDAKGLSTGSILIIIAGVFFLVYFVGGAAALYTLRGARGAEVIPNIDFWKNLPGLVKDGTVFVFSGFNVHAVSTAETYDRI